MRLPINCDRLFFFEWPDDDGAWAGPCSALLGGPVEIPGSAKTGAATKLPATELAVSGPAAEEMPVELGATVIGVLFMEFAAPLDARKSRMLVRPLACAAIVAASDVVYP